MRKADIFIALLLMAIGVLAIIDSVRLGFRWGMNGPEPGFFPFYLGTGLTICTFFVLLNNVLKYKRKNPDKRLIPEGGLKPILWVLVPAAVMVLLTGLVGLHIAAAIYLAFYMRVIGKIGWVTTLLISIFVPVTLYIAFDKIFLVPLPQGLWGAKLMPF